MSHCNVYSNLVCDEWQPYTHLGFPIFVLPWIPKKLSARSNTRQYIMYTEQYNDML